MQLKTNRFYKHSMAQSVVVLQDRRCLVTGIHACRRVLYLYPYESSLTVEMVSG